MLQRLAEEFQPHVWLNAHSGMEALFMPYDHKPSIPTGAAAATTFRMLQELNRLSCAGRCAIGSGGKSVGEPCISCSMLRMHKSASADCVCPAMLLCQTSRLAVLPVCSFSNVEPERCLCIPPLSCNGCAQQDRSCMRVKALQIRLCSLAGMPCWAVLLQLSRSLPQL